MFEKKMDDKCDIEDSFCIHVRNLGFEVLDLCLYLMYSVLISMMSMHIHAYIYVYV